MPVDVRRAIVRILVADGQEISGAGFVLTEDGLLATCAHVVVGADSRPGEKIRLEFQQTQDERTATVEPEGWREPIAEDVAILRLDGALPEGVEPLPLARAEQNDWDGFVSFGYSHVGQAVEANVRGQIGGLVAHREGWQLLEVISERISPGMSGAPVYDYNAERVIGMISEFPVYIDKDGHESVGDALGRQTTTNYATPIEVLVAVWPALEPVLRPVTDQARRHRAAQSVSSNAAGIHAGLGEGQAAAAAAAAALEPCGIDDAAIWGYDLDRQQKAFEAPFKDKEQPHHGVFAYAVSCDDPRLYETYLIARMEYYLRDELGRTLHEDKQPKIMLTPADLADAGRALAVVNRMLEYHYRVKLLDLVARKGPDCFLTILSRNAQSEQVQPFVAALDQQVEAEVSRTLQENKLYLIILWIDSGSGPKGQHPPFSSVPPVKDEDPFFTDTEKVVIHLKGFLWGAKMASERREAVCDRLRRQLRDRLRRQRRPDAWYVYEALRQTVEDLRGGKI